MSKTRNMTVKSCRFEETIFEKKQFEVSICHVWSLKLLNQNPKHPLFGARMN